MWHRVGGKDARPNHSNVTSGRLSLQNELSPCETFGFLVDTKTPETAVTGDLIGISDACGSGDHGGCWRASRLTPSAH